MKNNTLRISLFLLSLLSSLVYSQENLVLNPSFEDVHLDSLSCAAYLSSSRFNAAIEHWTNPTNATADLYHMTLSPICTMNPFDDFNPAGLPPRTGDAMVGLLLYSDDNAVSNEGEPIEYKEYVQGKLKEPLVQGTTYFIQFYTIIGKRSIYAANNMGFTFLEDPYFQDTQGTLELTPDFNYTEVLDSNENGEWTLMEFEYTAPTSGIQYFIIGNFFGTNETTIQHRNVYSRNTFAYYLIDDVSVTALIATFDPLGPYCKNTVFTLPQTSREGYHGTWSPAINNQETTTYTFTPDDPKFSPTTMTIEITPPTIDLLFDLETTFCIGTDFSLPTRSQDGIEGTWTPAINTQQTTTYTFHPVIEDPCLKPTTVTIEMVPPTIDLLFDLETTYCKGVNFSLPSISQNGIEGTWTPAINTHETTTYTFHPLIKNPCFKPFSVEINIFSLSNFTLEYYCKNGELLIQAMLPSSEKNAMLSWRINDHLIEDTSAIITLADYASLLHAGTTTIEATLVEENGCTSTASLELEDIQQYCFIPKGISPNGDGRNDFFDLHTFGGVAIQIFNRYGVKVYEQANYTNQWEGQSNSGTSLPSGTYFYQFITPQEERISGWVEVMR